ncbi:biotin F [Raphanus sativus]|uniref:8-amino-7-oxononanoate synthase isoform X1 n=2 Tax=Raphanus sativus TaxID=3726 RepID=A0A9W3C4A0_RAPSA|nr:8-amino-7-oxononanoate synthase isoform X1 [Raphanus sativus]XP_056846431.1 8-amino-7-oxononanoate synthase isoform X1 [Raphanus sativus]KAJ4882434.1 biotin F [Raphanus sativus]
MADNSWGEIVEEAVNVLESRQVLRSLRPISISKQNDEEIVRSRGNERDEYEVFDGMRQWDRTSVEVSVSIPTFHKWLHDVPSNGEESVSGDALDEGGFKKLLLFSGNDYLGLSSHPTIANAAASAVQEYGMGPKGSALICGYTTYHRLLESSLAELKKKEDCLVCPTGFAANMAAMVAIGSVASLLAASGKPLMNEKVAIFSDALNHASIIDGIRLAERQGNVEVFVYRHCDMYHLNSLISSCKMKRKVVVTDSLFSMDGDFAPMEELSQLRKKHGFLLVIDDAHGTFVCGENGGGVAEQFNCESDVDLCVGTLSKAAGCLGGFIACSKKWKQLIQSRGRSFIFSTAIPIPMVAAAYAAVVVARKEGWRRKAIWERVKEFEALSGVQISSPIISLVVGNQEKALQGSRYLLKSGFHVMAIRPPTVPPNSCRLRVTLSATHTTEDVKKLITALSSCLDFNKIAHIPSSLSPRL